MRDHRPNLQVIDGHSGDPGRATQRCYADSHVPNLTTATAPRRERVTTRSARPQARWVTWRFALPLSLLSVAPLAATEEAYWPSFRGPGGIAVSDNERLPLEWSTTQNVEWTADVPGLSWSSPIVADGKIFVTTAVSARESTKQAQLGPDFSNDYIAELRAEGLPIEEVLRKHDERFIEFPDENEIEIVLLAYALETGAELWRRVLYSGPPVAGRHAKNSFASESPVTDGETLFAYIGNLGLWAFTLDGEPKWHQPLDVFSIYMSFGTGGSPALTDEHVVILNDNQEHQFLAAYSKETGREVWRTARLTVAPDHFLRTGWTTPFVWRTPARTEIVALGPRVVVSYDTSGRELWRMGNHTSLPIPTPFAYDGNLYIVSGTPGDSLRPIASIRPGARGDLTLAEGQTQSEFVRWADPQAGSYVPTPVPYRGSLWVVYDKGILARYDAATGERAFRARIRGSAGGFSASPWAYRGKIFATDEEGTTFVFEASDGFELLHENTLDEMVMSSPALAGDRLILRTHTKLYSIREPAP